MQSLVLICTSVIVSFSIWLSIDTTSTNNSEEKSEIVVSPKETSIPIAESRDTTIIEMKTEGIELSYSVTEIEAKAGDILLIKYDNKSDMSHNLVLLKGEKDIRPVGIASLQAASTDWIPEGEKERILFHTGLLHSGEISEFSFEVPPPGIYPYICTFSAHWTVMQGRLISTE